MRFVHYKANRYVFNNRLIERQGIRGEINNGQHLGLLNPCNYKYIILYHRPIRLLD